VLARPGAPVSGDPGHPANFGRLCSKGSALGETLSLDGRLLHPEIDGRRVAWDTAIDRVAEGFAATQRAHGPDSVALYVSGQLLTEDYYAANKFAKGFLGTGNIDSNSRLCMASAVAGHRRGFGEDVVPVGYADVEAADLVVLVGSNTAWCHPVLYQRILAARAARPSMRIVVIDPRRTATCEGADLHIPLAPGTDVALFGGLLGHLWAGGHADQAYLAAHVNGLAASLAAATPPSEAAWRCGVPPELLATFYEWFATTPRVVTLFSQGVNQSSAGTDKVSAIINVHLLTGRIGRVGAGPFSITGQPNAMGGREVGALANTLAGHLEWDQPGDPDLLRRFWQAPSLAARPGDKAIDMFRAIGERRIRAVWILATNPAVSLPEARAVRRALAGCDLVVVSDCVRDSDTADLAHIRLPALGWGEKDGSVTNSERVISRQRAFLPAPGEARADWWAVAQVATRMGHGAAFAWRGPADIFREHAAVSGLGQPGARMFDISGLAALSDAQYADLPPTRWPCPAGDARVPLFADGRFPTADGRACMVPTPMREPAHAVSAAWPMLLLTGRVRDQWHTMTRTGKAPRLLSHLPEPFLAIHPDDAAAIGDAGAANDGLASGALALVESAWGRAVLRVRHDDGMRRGCVFAPMHWTDRFCPAGRINPAVNAAPDPVSGQPELKHTPVRVRPWSAAWHGFVLTRCSLGADLAPFTAVLPMPGGVWRHEVAGQGDAAAAFAGLRASLGKLTGGWITLVDDAAGLHRAALLAGGTLQACVFVGPDHALPERDWLAGLFAAVTIPPADRRALLAGRPAGDVVVDPWVCVCHGVGERTIRSAIATGCDSVEAVGAATRAGTNCGSCRPEIRALLRTPVPALQSNIAFGGIAVP
jgi:assimilatory nitrate reductase catalytic subunit